MTSILAAISAIGAIVTGVVWLVKRLTPTPAQTNSDIDKAVSEEKDQVEHGGRPQW